MKKETIEDLKEKLLIAFSLIEKQKILLKKSIDNYDNLLSLCKKNNLESRKDVIIQFVSFCDIVFEKKGSALERDDIDFIASYIINNIDMVAIEEGISL